MARYPHEGQTTQQVIHPTLYTYTYTRTGENYIVEVQIIAASEEIAHRFLQAYILEAEPCDVTWNMFTLQSVIQLQQGVCIASYHSRFGRF